MGTHLEDFFYAYNFGTAAEVPVESLIKGNFSMVKLSPDEKWVLIQHTPTGFERWVRTAQVRVSDVRIAFYDSDPTFLPESER